MPNDVVGTTEAAALLNVTPRTLRRYAGRPDFPQPITRLAAGPIWRRADIERWAKKHLPLPPGRPRKGEA